MNSREIGDRLFDFRHSGAANPTGSEVSTNFCGAIPVRRLRLKAIRNRWMHSSLNIDYLTSARLRRASDRVKEMKQHPAICRVPQRFPDSATLRLANEDSVGRLPARRSARPAGAVVFGEMKPALQDWATGRTFFRNFPIGNRRFVRFLVRRALLQCQVMCNAENPPSQILAGSAQCTGERATRTPLA